MPMYNLNLLCRSLGDPIERNRLDDLTLLERGSVIDFFNVSNEPPEPQ